MRLPEPIAAFFAAASRRRCLTRKRDARAWSSARTERRRQALQCLSQQRYRQPDRFACRDLSRSQRITGVDFFRAMARFHIRATPPTSPLLFEYGRDFPDFIETYEYARAMPWLADIARIERAWLDAYHAADAGPLICRSAGRDPTRAARATRCSWRIRQRGSFARNLRR